MAQADFNPTPAFRTAGPKTRMTIFFAMLILSFIAMLIACLFMYLEIRNYGGFGAVPGKVSSLDQPQQDLLANINRALAG